MQLTPRGERFMVGTTAVDALRFEEVIERILNAAREHRRFAVHFCSANGIVEAARMQSLRDAFEAAELVAADGMPLVWLGRLRGRRVDRACGPDVMLAILDRSRAEGLTHFFYGGGPGVAQRLAEQLRDRLPGLRVVGAMTPSFAPLSPVEERNLARRIEDTAPDFLWVGVSTPKQDLWLRNFREMPRATVLLAVGAAFDFLSGERRRAPILMQRVGLEWLFRLASEPARLWRSYTITNVVFVLVVLRGLAREFANSRRQ